MDDSQSLKYQSRVDISNLNNGDLPEYLKIEAENDLHEKYEWTARDVEALRDMVLLESKLKSRLDKPFLLTFLRARKFDYDRSVAMIQKYYQSHHDNEDIYSNLQPSTVAKVLSCNIQTVLSRPDYGDRTVLLFSAEAWNPEVITINDIFRAQILILEHIVRLPITQLKGVSAVVDCKGLTKNHVYKLTPPQIKKMVSMIQEVFPLRFKAIHFVHEPSIFELAFSLFKPFLSDTIKSRIYFHGDNVSSLHNHIPAEILPHELGGTAGPADNVELMSNLNQQEDYFKEHFSYGYSDDETNGATKKSSVQNAVTGMASSIGNYYRRMCID